MSGLLLILGAILKCMIQISMLFPYIGQFLAALSQPLILSCPPVIAANWFREEKVNLIIK